MEKRQVTPEVEALRHLFEQYERAEPHVIEAAEDVAARYIVALAVAKGYGEQLDADLEAALEEARRRQS